VEIFGSLDHLAMNVQETLPTLRSVTFTIPVCVTTSFDAYRWTCECRVFRKAVACGLPRFAGKMERLATLFARAGVEFTWQVEERFSPIKDREERQQEHNFLNGTRYFVDGMMAKGDWVAHLEPEMWMLLDPAEGDADDWVAHLEPEIWCLLDLAEGDVDDQVE
jgi:hypothetical protein